MIVIRPLRGALGTDVMVGAETQAGTSALQAAMTGTSLVNNAFAPSLSLYERAIVPSIAAKSGESFPVDEVASRTVDGQSSATIEDTQPAPAVVPPPSQESGEVMGATVDQWLTADQAPAGFDLSAFWSQHKTKIIIAGAVVAAYLILK